MRVIVYTKHGTVYYFTAVGMVVVDRISVGFNRKFFEKKEIERIETNDEELLELLRSYDYPAYPFRSFS